MPPVSVGILAFLQGLLAVRRGKERNGFAVRRRYHECVELGYGKRDELKSGRLCLYDRRVWGVLRARKKERFLFWNGDAVS